MGEGVSHMDEAAIRRRNGGYLHGDAYMLMKYQSDDGREVEYIWNSRDGVTPFIVRSRSDTELRHVDWQRDRRIPDYQPTPGERMFVDLTLGRARQIAEGTVERWWDDPSYPMREQFPSKQEAVRVLTEEMMRHPGQPDLVEVGGRIAGDEQPLAGEV